MNSRDEFSFGESGLARASPNITHHCCHAHSGEGAGSAPKSTSRMKNSIWIPPDSGIQYFVQYISISTPPLGGGFRSRKFKIATVLGYRNDNPQPGQRRGPEKPPAVQEDVTVPEVHYATALDKIPATAAPVIPCWIRRPFTSLAYFTKRSRRSRWKEALALALAALQTLALPKGIFHWLATCTCYYGNTRY